MGTFKPKVWAVSFAWAVFMLFVVSFEARGQDLQWCLKTDQGQYIEMARVSMLVAVDGQSTFEVVVREGQGAVGVSSITRAVVYDYRPGRLHCHESCTVVGEC